MLPNTHYDATIPTYIEQQPDHILYAIIEALPTLYSLSLTSRRMRHRLELLRDKYPVLCHKEMAPLPTRFTFSSNEQEEQLARRLQCQLVYPTDSELQDFFQPPGLCKKYLPHLIMSAPTEASKTPTLRKRASTFFSLRRKTRL